MSKIGLHKVTDVIFGITVVINKFVTSSSVNVLLHFAKETFSLQLKSLF